MEKTISEHSNRKRYIAKRVNTVTVDIKETPDRLVDYFARETLSALKSFFQSPKVKAEYEAWLVEYQKNQKLGGVSAQ